MQNRTIFKNTFLVITSNYYNQYKIIYIYIHKIKVLLGYIPNYSQIFLSWHSGVERQTCHVTLIVPHVMN